MKGLFTTALASLSPFPPAYGSSSRSALERATVSAGSPALGPLQALPSKGLRSFRIRCVFRGATLVLYITRVLECVAVWLKYLSNTTSTLRIVRAGMLIPAADDYHALYLPSAPYFACGWELSCDNCKCSERNDQLVFTRTSS